jgi:hypothetical protein
MPATMHVKEGDGIKHAEHCETRPPTRTTAHICHVTLHAACQCHLVPQTKKSHLRAGVHVAYVQLKLNSENSCFSKLLLEHSV